MLRAAPYLQPGALALLASLILPEEPGAQVLRENLWVTNGWVRTVAVSNNTISLGGEFTQVGPATGALAFWDRNTGAVRQPYHLVIGEVNAIVSDGAGGWWIGGAFPSVGGHRRGGLAHLDAAGNVMSWDANMNGAVYALAFSGGILYVGGEFNMIGGQFRPYLAAVQAGGGVTAWDPAADRPVRAIAVMGNTVYVGGEFTHIGGQARLRLAASPRGDRRLHGHRDALEPAC
jgi:hypothetical protein